MDAMEIFKILLLVLLICCAIGAGLAKRLLTSVIIYMSYSSIMAITWALLESPDLAITEAAVGAGVSSILFFMCLRKIGSTHRYAPKEKENRPVFELPDEDEEDLPIKKQKKKERSSNEKN